MPNYRRRYQLGGTYFFTHVTHQRHPWLCDEIARTALRKAIIAVRQKYPFTMDAIVLLPDHLHCIWTLPDGDSDYVKRWRLIKLMVTKDCRGKLDIPPKLGRSAFKRGEGNLWQRRYWEHTIRDEDDFYQHCNYIHNNPVKHGWVENPTDWQFSSIHRLIPPEVCDRQWEMNPQDPLPTLVEDVD
jgi:putative transposase